MRINFMRSKLMLIKEKGVNYKVDEDFKIKSPEDMSKLIYDVFDLQGEAQEHLIVICLDTKNRILGVKTVFTGTLNRSIVHPREIFSIALLCASASIIVAHNHPSGDVMPSQQDISLTKRLKDIGEIMGIELLDHIIIGSRDECNYLSMKEERYI